MNTIEKLTWLQAHACSLSIEINDHRGVYETIEQGVAHKEGFFTDVFTYDEAKAVKTECLRRGQLVCLQCYPHTPVGFLLFIHYDVAAVIDLAFEVLEPMLQPRPELPRSNDLDTAVRAALAKDPPSAE